MFLKAHLVTLLSKAIKAKGLNQYQAAEVLGIDNVGWSEPKLALMRAIEYLRKIFDRFA